jgi:hypothetical protein
VQEGLENLIQHKQLLKQLNVAAGSAKGLLPVSDRPDRIIYLKQVSVNILSNGHRAGAKQLLW